MNKSIKTFLLSSIFSLSLTIPRVHGMEPDLPEHTKICCLASLAVYGDEHEGSKNARMALENSNYTCEQAYENPSVNLRMELWKHLNGQSFIAIRGTIPTKENLLSDGGIIKYGLDVPEPYTYLANFSTTMATKWFEEKLITDPCEDLWNSLPSATTFYDRVHKIGTTITGVTGGGIGALTLTMGTGIVVGGLLTYAAYKIGESYHPETTAINSLVSTCQAALKKTNEWIEDRLQNGCSIPILTGHSLGGYVVTTVAELSPKLEIALTLNAPGGAARFIRTQKKYILGEQDDRITWLKKSLVSTEEEFPHEFRNITLNIARQNEIISCFAEDNVSRTSILIPDYKEGCPMSICDYPMQNHSAYNLAKHFDLL